MEDLISSECDSEGLQQQIENILVKAHTQARMSGLGSNNIPGELEIFIQKLLTPKLPWYTILNKYVSQIVKDDYSYRRPNRRYIPDYYLPTLYSEAIGDITIAIDISGSVRESEFTQFISEVTHVMKRIKPKELTLILFDTKIKSINKIKSLADLAKVKFVGRGGTSIEELITELNRTKPVVSIVLTDGDFRIPSTEVKSPLIWLIHNNPSFKIHYGKTVHYKI
jgi:predicted metal-dependent peptidase